MTPNTEHVVGEPSCEQPRQAELRIATGGFHRWLPGQILEQRSA